MEIEQETYLLKSAINHLLGVKLAVSCGAW